MRRTLTSMIHSNLFSKMKSIIITAAFIMVIIPTTETQLPPCFDGKSAGSACCNNICQKGYTGETAALSTPPVPTDKNPLVFAQA